MAKAAIEQHMANLGIEIDVNPYEPRDSTKKAVSNIFVKNFPVSWDDAKLRETFSPFGNILSIFRQTDEKIGLPFAFISYGQEGSQDVNYGISCAQKAQQAIHGMKVTEDGQEYTLYAQPALPKDDREIEKKKAMMRYKLSKKRCNLYVKSFPETFTQQDFATLFGPYGEIESVKILPEEGKGLYAFVCYKTPDSALVAK